MRRWRALSTLSTHFVDVVRGLPTLRAYRRGKAQTESIATYTDEYRPRDDVDTAHRVPLGVRARAGGIARHRGRRRRARDPARARQRRALAGVRDPRARSRALRAAPHRVGAVPRERRRARRGRPPLRADRPRRARAGDRRRARARSAARSSGWASRTRIADGCSTASSSSCSPASGWRSSGRAAPASRRCSRCCSASSRPTPAVSRSPGVDLATVSSSAWRRQLAWVPQRPLLEPGSVADAVRLGSALGRRLRGDRGACVRRARRAARRRRADALGGRAASGRVRARAAASRAAPAARRADGASRRGVGRDRSSTCSRRCRARGRCSSQRMTRACCGRPTACSSCATDACRCSSRRRPRDPPLRSRDRALDADARSRRRPARHVGVSDLAGGAAARHPLADRRDRRRPLLRTLARGAALPRAARLARRVVPLPLAGARAVLHAGSSRSCRTTSAARGPATCSAVSSQTSTRSSTCSCA